MSRPVLQERLILASASPRRAKLLASAGYTFEQQIPPIDETALDVDALTVQSAVEALASFKASSIAEQHDHGIVIGSDTMVVATDQRIGKPADADDARDMLMRLIGSPHDVYTAVAIVDARTHRRIVFTDRTTVTIADPESDDLDAYLASGQWAGKAGGYNLDELKDRWRFEVDGDPTTVIGLPMQRLGGALQRIASAGT